MKKRILKLTIAIVVILGAALGLVSCAGGAAKLPDADSANGMIANTSISWSYNADTKTLTLAGTGEIPDSASPADVAWYGVRHSIKKIEMPEGITRIGDCAFYYCPQLESVDMPSTVTQIGRLSFAFCSSLKSIEIPEGVISIGESCFELCSALESIYIPASVTAIGARAFAHCSSLKEAVVMAQISELKDRTFMGCTALDSLVLHEASRNITRADNAFESAKTNFDGATFNASVNGDVTLTVNYVYENGGEAAAAVVSTHKRGESYSVVSPTLEGYTADKLTVSGVITSDKVETVSYKAAAVETETEAAAPADTEKAPEEENDGIGMGEIIAIVILVVVIGAIVVLAIVMMRSDKKSNGKNTPKKK